MAAYLIAEHKFNNFDRFAEYRDAAQQSVDPFSGHFIARAGTLRSGAIPGARLETLEGDWTPARIVMVEFESFDVAKQWYHSSQYQAAKAIRDTLGVSNFILVEATDQDYVGRKNEP